LTSWRLPGRFRADAHHTFSRSAPRRAAALIMAEEIERKYLVVGEAWRALAEPVLLCQGYLCDEPLRVVRVRLAGNGAWLTIKGISRGASRSEYEYAIPTAEARAMLNDLCLRPLVEKRRSRIPHAGMIWEVDEFLGENAGLILAEVELAIADQQVALPPWVGEEVTSDPRYYNSNLLKNPYSRWSRPV
jgi:adenylate cyclase